MNIHQNIKRLRIEQNLTLEEVGKRTGTTKQTIKRYEDGVIATIPYDRIVALAKCFNVTPGDLMGWEDKSNIIESARTDVMLSNMEDKLKQYALKLAKLPKDKQAQIMSLIDMLEDK